MDIDVDTSKESDHMKNAEERSLKSTSSSEYSYTSGTCAPGQLEGFCLKYSQVSIVRKLR